MDHGRPERAGSERGLEGGVIRACPGGTCSSPALGPGVYPLELRSGRQASLYVPPSPAEEPAPLLLMLHGAGGRPEHAIDLVSAQAERLGLLVLAPRSLEQTWDGVVGRLGPDLAWIDELLQWTFARFAVDERRLAVGGFSDGASYALTLGLANGALFGHVLAFAPGFMAPPRVEGRPRIFISHGRQDRVLPIERCGRPLAARLKQAGYAVDYREFDGGHVVPPELLRAALDRFLP